MGYPKLSVLNQKEESTRIQRVNQYLVYNYSRIEIENLTCLLKIASDLFVCVDGLHSGQQFFSHAGTISCLPGFN